MKTEIQAKLSEIYQRDGALHPAVVVDEARKPQSPLHSQFDWDDSAAAEKYRLQQARQLIRVAVTIIPSLSNRPVREYVSISNLRQTGTGSYLATVDVAADPDLYEKAKRDALNQLARLEKQYRHIRELSPIWDAITQQAALSIAA